MNGRRKRILTALGSLSFATLLAEIAFKRQLDKDLQKEMQGASEKWNSPSPPCFARSLPPRGSREAADNFCLIVRKHDEARGSLDARQGFTFLPKKMKFTEFFFRQGENVQRPLQSAEADSFPDGEAGNEG